jgi:hypothetical protein
MPKKLWKVDIPLKLWEKGTQTYLSADPGELLEEVTLQEKILSPEDVLVFRTKETKIIRTYVVSRPELAANARTVSE